MTFEQRQQIITECVEDLISPNDLARKWNCSADTVRTWVRKAGKTLPKQYKNSIYSCSAAAQANNIRYDHPSLHLLPKAPSMAALHCHLCDNEIFLKQEDLLKHYAQGHFYQELLGKEDLEYCHRKGASKPFQCFSCSHHSSDEEKMMLHIALVHSVIVDILEEKENAMILTAQYDPEKQKTRCKPPAEKHKMSGWVKKQWVIKECAEEMISVAYLQRRWRCSSNVYGKRKSSKHTLIIESAVEAAGLRVPKQYTAAIYPENPFRPKNCKLIFCHLELLRCSSSPTMYLTQLAATNTNNNYNFFVPIVPSILKNLSDSHSVGNLFEVMKIVKDHQGSFLFRDQVWKYREIGNNDSLKNHTKLKQQTVSEARRLECVEEEKALELFFNYLELAGPNVVLVGVDEDAVGVLLQKLEEHNAAKLLELVVGYNWWSRIHRGAFDFEQNVDDFYKSKIEDDVCCKGRRIRKEINTCPVVVKKLWAAIKYVASEIIDKSENLSDFADRVGISMLIEPRVPEEQMEAFEDFINKEEEESREIMVRLTNSFHPVPTTSFVLHKLEKVDLSSDEESEERNLDQRQSDERDPGEYFEEEVKFEVKTEEVYESPGVNDASDHAEKKGTKLEEPKKEEFEAIGEYFEHETKIDTGDVKNDLTKVVSQENREPLKELKAENKVESTNNETDFAKRLTGKHQIGEYFEEETSVGKKEEREEKEEREHDENVAAGEYFEEENNATPKELKAENNVDTNDKADSVLTGKKQVEEYFEEETTVGKGEDKEEREHEDNIAAGGHFEENDFDKNYIHCTIENKDEWYHSESECFHDGCDFDSKSSSDMSGSESEEEDEERDEVSVVAEIRAPDPDVERRNAERAKASYRERRKEAGTKWPDNRRKRTRLLEIQESNMIKRIRAQAKIALESRREREKVSTTLTRISCPSPTPSETSPLTIRPTNPKTRKNSLLEEEARCNPSKRPLPSFSKPSVPTTRPTTTPTPLTGDLSEDELYSNYSNWILQEHS